MAGADDKTHSRTRRLGELVYYKLRDCGAYNPAVLRVFGVLVMIARRAHPPIDKSLCPFSLGPAVYLGPGRAPFDRKT